MLSDGYVILVYSRIQQTNLWTSYYGREGAAWNAIKELDVLAGISSAEQVCLFKRWSSIGRQTAHGLQRQLWAGAPHRGIPEGGSVLLLCPGLRPHRNMRILFLLQFHYLGTLCLVLILSSLLVDQNNFLLCRGALVSIV